MKKILSLISVTLMMALVVTASVSAQEEDTESPSDVENVQATALNGAVELTWDAATDDTEVAGYQVHYGTESVSAPGQVYDDFEDVGDVTSFMIEDLANGVEYYFSVVAYDAAGNESLQWAIEASAIPLDDGSEVIDDEAPQVTEAEAMNREEVKVVFSEDIVLPEEDPQDAFTIEDDDTFEALAVLEVRYDQDEETEEDIMDTVILTTMEQNEGSIYKLTVGIDIEDNAGNPMISGTSDTAIFDGSGEEKPQEDQDGPEIVSAEGMDSTHFVINFNEAVVLNIDPSEHFEIVSEEDELIELSVLGVELGRNDQGVEDASVIVTTNPQQEMRYIVSVTDLKDEFGNEIDELTNQIVFQGFPEVDVPDDPDNGPDFMAPEDVARFLAKSVLEANKYMVTLSWEIPEGNAETSFGQNLYRSEDRGENYAPEANLGNDVSEYEVGGLNPGEYWFKITQTDENGAESQGVITKVILAETGPGIVGLALVSLGLGRVVSRRRK